MDRNTAQKMAQALVAQMTLDEKATQLRYEAPAIPRLGVPAYNWWNEGLHGVARAGTATMFPQAIGMAAAFDDTLLEAVADTISTEARAKYNMQAAHGDRDIYKGLTLWSPNVNLFRDPRWGRGQETYGEDPYLTSRLGVAFVRGLQGKGKTLKTAACAKHFAVHSGPEAIRHSFDAVVSKKDLRETYLPAFEALVTEANVESVMGAYNRVNGEPACASKTLLADILRGEWGFQGHVVSDCWALKDIHENHHVTATAPESAALAMEAGCDLNCGSVYLQILAAYQEGRVTEAQITRACERLMTTRYLLGTLGDEGSEYDAVAYDENDTEDNATLSQTVAEKCMVLLKNDGVLPLDRNALNTVGVIGPNANSIACLEGNYCGTSSRYVTYLEGIRAACEGKARVFYAQGSHLYKDRTSNLAMADDRLAEAVAVAERCDVSILCLGLDATLEGEEGDTGNEYSSGDKRDLHLPPCQQKLLDAVAAVGKPVVVVLSAGSALAVSQGNAILQAWYPGQAGGTALARILFGEVSPSGRLPVTFYHGVEDLPPFEDYAMANRTYRYYTGEALYPFGFGLSYSRFAYSDAKYENGAVTVTVTNTGDCDADEVIEVYVKNLDSADAVPNHRLCSFRRVPLGRGERATVTLPLAEDAFLVVDGEGNRVKQGKRHRLYIGGSQPDERSAALLGAQPITITVEE
ncbi:MAG TPA: glycoside hydrolase family 3 C-terminal domain-containing protein [Candidatus Limiplasma sp.]|nr:glycoside hydrolase family 3 C-terminal domain-containing protein [Candidatus Limiplasma sp.]